MDRLTLLKALCVCTVGLGLSQLGKESQRQYFIKQAKHNHKNILYGWNGNIGIFPWSSFRTKRMLLHYINSKHSLKLNLTCLKQSTYECIPLQNTSSHEYDIYKYFFIYVFLFLYRKKHWYLLFLIGQKLFKRSLYKRLNQVLFCLNQRITSALYWSFIQTTTAKLFNT